MSTNKILSIKRIVSDANDPTSWAHGELIYNEVSDTLYYGKDPSSNLVEKIGGTGNFFTTYSSQTIATDVDLTGSVSDFTGGNVSVDTQPLSAIGNYIANLDYVREALSFLDGGNFDSVAGPGVYWYTTTTDNDLNKWHNLSSWYTDSSHLYQAGTLPNSSIDVVVLGNIGPYINLDRQDWVNPKSIHTGSTSISAYSNQNNTLTTNITGTVYFFGNAEFDN
jgi:hypothetical protein